MRKIYLRAAQRFACSGKALIWASLAMILSAPETAAAGDTLQTERALNPIMILNNERLYLRAHGIAPPRPEEGLRKPGEAEAPEELSQSQNLAILPQVGQSPEEGTIFGLELSDINVGKNQYNFDLNSTYSTRGVLSLDGSVSSPHLFGTNLIGLVGLHYTLQPTQKFFGLGNNSVGSDELSTHERNSKSILFTLGWQPWQHTVIAGTFGVRRTSIGAGKTLHDEPATTDRFPDLPGLPGGWDNTIALSAIYNTHRDFTRPYQGWGVIGRIARSGPETGSDYSYNRYTLDASYLFPLGSANHVLGLRFVGEKVTGSNNGLPFFDFSSLGGLDDLHGYLDQRFLGQSKVLGQIEFRQLLADFDFYNIWRARIDGTLFVSGGRIFLDRSRLPSAVQSDKALFPGLENKLRFSYGGGVLIALSEAITARIELGFSNENTALLFLAFGQNF